MRCSTSAFFSRFTQFQSQLAALATDFHFVAAPRSNDNPAIVCADIADAKHSHDQLSGSHALARRKRGSHCRPLVPHAYRLELRYAFES